MGKKTFVTEAARLYEYADHLRWAASDLYENYQDMKTHAEYFSQKWGDSSAEKFMLILEQEEHVIQELVNEFTRFEGAVRKRADMVNEYVRRGKNYSI